MPAFGGRTWVCSGLFGVRFGCKASIGFLWICVGVVDSCGVLLPWSFQNESVLLLASCLNGSGMPWFLTFFGVAAPHLGLKRSCGFITFCLFCKPGYCRNPGICEL